MTLAYANTTGLDLGPVRADLAVTAGTVVVEVDHICLIRLGRDGHLYRWDQVGALPLA